MNVLITGSSGYIGTHLTYLLKQHRFNIIYFDLVEDQDIRDPECLYDVFNNSKQRGEPIQAVVHLAALISVPDSQEDPLNYYETNTSSIVYLLKFMNMFDCHKLVFASTAAVYKTSDEQLFENSLQHPTSVYGLSKKLAEDIITTSCPNCNIDYTIFRFFNVAGTNDHVKRSDRHNHLIPAIIGRVLGDKPIHLYGDDYPTPDGSCVRDYIHVDDICNAIYLALQSICSNNIINLGTNVGYSVKEVIDTFGSIYQKPFITKHSDRRSGDPAILVANAEKAYNVLGWTPKYNLYEMIDSALEYW